MSKDVTNDDVLFDELDKEIDKDAKEIDKDFAEVDKMINDLDTGSCK